jgi:AhpD family alkylhydroperoxidase
MLHRLSKLSTGLLSQIEHPGGTVTKAIDEFNQYRVEMNERILGSDHLGIKRFFALDHQAYEEGALDSKSKELLGLVASLVLRCDDCITYHVLQCIEQGVKREEFLDTFNVALVVGGSITIPHLRRAFERMDEAFEETKS